MAQEKSLGDANARRQQLHELLRAAPPTEEECGRYLPRLEDYIAAQLAGDDYLARFAGVALHLDRCVTCADSYARLYELEVALAADALPDPAAMPAPDLSFLTQPAQSLLARLAGALTTSATTLRLQFTDELLALLQPSQPAPLTRAAGDDARYAEVLYELQPEQLPSTALPFKMTLYRDAQQPDQCLLEVVVMPPGVHWPNLGGYVVTLQIGETETAQTSDAWGAVAFAALPIARVGEITLLVERPRDPGRADLT